MSWFGGYWLPVKDGDDRVRALFRRHYSRYVYKDGRKPLRFVGPGEKIVLLTADGTAAWAWRKFIDPGGQKGLNNMLFRNESSILSSDLIREACLLAAVRWPGERAYTYIDAQRIASPNPGYCYQQAGWVFVREQRTDGRKPKPLLTGSGKHILEFYLPTVMERAA